MVNTQYQAYQNNAITTASGEKLTLMLYNGAIKFCNQAKEAIDRKDVPEAHRLIMRSQSIIQQLQVSLDDRYPVSEQFNQIYDFINYQLIEANINKKTENIDVAIDFIRDIRDTWQEAMKLANKA